MKTALLAAVASTALLAACTPEGSQDDLGRIHLDQTTADAAIDVLGLSDSGSRNITFDSAIFDDGVYTFTNVVITRESDDDEIAVPSGKVSSPKEDGLEEIHASRMIIDSPRLNENGDVLLYAFAMEEMTFIGSDETTHVTLDRFSVDQPNDIMSSELASVMFTSDNSDLEPSWEQYAFGGIAMEGLEIVTSDNDGPNQVSLDRFAVEHYDSEGLGRFEIIGFEAGGASAEGPVNVHMAEFSIDGLDTSMYHNMFAAMEAGETENEVAEAYMESVFSNPMNMMTIMEAMTLRDINVTAPGVIVDMDYLTMFVEEGSDELRSVMEMGLLSLVPDAAHPTGAQMSMGLGMMGYDRLDMSMASESVYNLAEDRAYTIGDNFIEFKDALRIDFGQDISGYNAYFEALRNLELSTDESEASEEEMDAFFEAIGPLTLNQMSIRLEDKSLLERGLAFAATTQGLPPEQLRAQAGMMVGMGLMAAPPEVPRTLIAEFSTALTSFINEGGTLIMNMNPPEALSVGEVMEQIEAGTFDYNALGLSFTAEPPVE